MLQGPHASSLTCSLGASPCSAATANGERRAARTATGVRRRRMLRPSCAREDSANGCAVIRAVRISPSFADTESCLTPRLTSYEVPPSSSCHPHYDPTLLPLSPAVFSPLPRRCRSRRHGRHLWRGCCDATPSPRVSPRGRAHYAGARRHTLDSVWATVDALARDRQPNAWRRRAGQSPLVGSDLMCGTSALVTYLAAGMPLPSPPRVSERTGGAGSPRAGAGQ